MGRSLIAKDALRPFGLKMDHMSAEGTERARAVIRVGAGEIGAAGAALVPKKSGKTASQIAVKQEDSWGNTWSVTSRTLQGYLMQWGADAHTIKPREKKAMRIGNAIIRGPIRHPGVKARRWLTKAYKQVAPMITARMEAMLGEVIRHKTG